jgi:ferredoxin
MAKYRVVVDPGLCQGHSVCMAEAQEVFRLIDTDQAYPQAEPIVEYPPPDLISKAEAAAEYCPNGAITIVYED